MKTSARFILSVTAGLSLAALTVISAFIAVSPAVPATALGLLAIYGMVELMIHSYSPGRVAARPSVARRVIASRAVVCVPALVEFPACDTRARAA